MAVEYCQCSDDIPVMSSDLLVRLVELLKVGWMCSCVHTLDNFIESMISFAVVDFQLTHLPTDSWCRRSAIGWLENYNYKKLRCGILT